MATTKTDEEKKVSKVARELKPILKHMKGIDASQGQIETTMFATEGTKAHSFEVLDWVKDKGFLSALAELVDEAPKTGRKGAAPEARNAVLSILREYLPQMLQTHKRETEAYLLPLLALRFAGHETGHKDETEPERNARKEKNAQAREEWIEQVKAGK